MTKEEIRRKISDLKRRIAESEETVDQYNTVQLAIKVVANGG